MNLNWQEVFNKFSDDLVNAFDLFTGNLKLTKVFKATIIEKINDTVYKVLYKNAEYKVKSYYDLIIGDIVWVCAPGGDWDSLFVQSYNGFLDRIVTTDKVVNNLTTNVAGTVLDGRMGKSLKDQLDQQNSNLAAFQDDFRTAKPLPDDTDINALIAPGTYNVYTTINGNKYRWILVVDWCNASGVSLSRQTAYYFLGAAPVAPITRYQYNTGSSYNWSQWY